MQEHVLFQKQIDLIKGVKMTDITTNDKGYSKFTYSMNSEGNVLTIRSDNWDEIIVAVPECKKFLLKDGEEKRIAVKESIKEHPTPFPSNVTKPEKCPNCGSTELTFVSGTNKKTGKDWMAFDCLSCKTKKDDKEYPTRIFVNPIDIEKKKPESLPKTENSSSGGKKGQEEVNCVSCGRKLGYGVIKFCQSKKIPPTCMDCQKKGQ